MGNTDSDEAGMSYRQQQQTDASRRADSSISRLEGDISVLRRQKDALESKIIKYMQEGKKKDANNEATKLRFLEENIKSKESSIMRLRRGVSLHSDAREFANTQKIMSELAADKKRIIDDIDIGVVTDENIESRVLDRELSKIKSSVGITEENDEEEKAKNDELINELMAGLSVSNAYVATNATTNVTTTTNFRNNNNNNNNNGNSNRRTEIERLLDL